MADRDNKPPNITAGDLLVPDEGPGTRGSYMMWDFNALLQRLQRIADTPATPGECERGPCPIGGPGHRAWAWDGAMSNSDYQESWWLGVATCPRCGFQIPLDQNFVHCGPTAVPTPEDAP